MYVYFKNLYPQIPQDLSTLNSKKHMNFNVENL